MTAKATRRFAIVVALVIVAMVLLWFSRPRPHGLAISFVGWSDTYAFSPNVPEEIRATFPKGQYALLSITNDGTSTLRLDSYAVEFESNGHWVEVVPKQWSGLHCSRWVKGRIVSLTCPSEVPSGARWRIRYVCALDVSYSGGLRQRLNQMAKKALGTNTLAFCAPVVMVSPEIQPANVQQGDCTEYRDDAPVSNWTR